MISVYGGGKTALPSDIYDLLTYKPRKSWELICICFLEHGRGLSLIGPFLLVVVKWVVSSFVRSTLLWVSQLQP